MKLMIVILVEVGNEYSGQLSRTCNEVSRT